MREILHLQAGQCGNQIGSKVRPAAELKRKGVGINLSDCIYVRGVSTIVAPSALHPAPPYPDPAFGLLTNTMKLWLTSHGGTLRDKADV